MRILYSSGACPAEHDKKMVDENGILQAVK